MTPAGVPDAIIAKIHYEIAQALKARDVRDKLAADGAEPVGNTPEEFARLIRREIEKWGKVTRAAGLKPE
jgi:tripartite-type tricarboxylate transporter receptor subunit TctC